MDEPEESAEPPSCDCVQDLLAALPERLRLRVSPAKGGLRQATCRSCGLTYLTNQASDELCVRYEEKGGQAPGSGAPPAD
jgi:hypothetical protein